MITKRHYTEASKGFLNLWSILKIESCSYKIYSKNTERKWTGRLYGRVGENGEVTNGKLSCLTSFQHMNWDGHGFWLHKPLGKRWLVAHMKEITGRPQKKNTICLPLRQKKPLRLLQPTLTLGLWLCSPAAGYEAERPGCCMPTAWPRSSWCWKPHWPQAHHPERSHSKLGSCPHTQTLVPVGMKTSWIFLAYFLTPISGLFSQIWSCDNLQLTKLRLLMLRKTGKCSRNDHNRLYALLYKHFAVLYAL